MRFPSLALLLVLAFPALPAAPPAEAPRVEAVKARRQYRDYYGTALTTAPGLLATPQETFRWGITNPKPQEMAYFGGTLQAGGRFRVLKTRIYADPGIKAPLEFTFRKDDRNGEVLDVITVRPGQTVPVELALRGARAVFFATELKIQHDKAQRIVLGEPTFSE